MTDDTGQPTVDRLAAYRLLRFRHRAATMYEIPTEIVERELPEALEFIAATAAPGFATAASETRATERKAVLEIIADVRRRYAPATAAIAALDYAAHRIECATATPAQSEGK